jgi:hypothetical protein
MVVSEEVAQEMRDLINTYGEQKAEELLLATFQAQAAFLAASQQGGSVPNGNINDPDGGNGAGGSGGKGGGSGSGGGSGGSEDEDEGEGDQGPGPRGGRTATRRAVLWSEPGEGTEDEATADPGCDPT